MRLWRFSFSSLTFRGKPVTPKMHAKTTARINNARPRILVSMNELPQLPFQNGPCPSALPGRGSAIVPYSFTATTEFWGINGLSTHGLILWPLQAKLKGYRCWHPLLLAFCTGVLLACVFRLLRRDPGNRRTCHVNFHLAGNLQLQIVV